MGYDRDYRIRLDDELAVFDAVEDEVYRPFTLEPAAEPN